MNVAASSIDTIRALAALGIGRKNIEATIGHAFTDAELTEFRRAQVRRELLLEKKRRQGPKSTAERVRDFNARANELPEIDPTPRHPRLKERCRYDLALFGWYYCRMILRHRPSPDLVAGLIRDVQEAILHGGKFVKLYGRGAGKTTWMVYIAVVWAILYGHRRYPVLISATAKLAKKNLKTVKKLLTRSKAIAQDFPEIAVALASIGDIAQRTAGQTYHGVPTDAVWGSEQITLPTLRDSSGALLGPGCGAIVASVGIGGAVRGSNEAGQRPDFILFDDPQTKKIAHSPSLVEDVISYIHQDALMLAGHDRVLSAFVTITPQCYGDVATELTSASKHPEWSCTVEPFIKTTCPDWPSLVQQFVDAYTEDAANHDTRFTISTAWYRANRAKFAAVRVVDSEQYDHEAEVDVVHHLLNLRASLGEIAFNAEIMMKVSDAGSALEISPDLVANALNGYPRLVCPPPCDTAVAFCDINLQRGKGLSWGVVAFGPGRVAAVVAYGRYPERGPLVEPNSSDLVVSRRLSAAIRAVASIIASLHLRDTRNHAVRIQALGFDRGYRPDIVCRTLRVIRKTYPLPFELVAVRGFPWNKFGVRAKDLLRRGDHVFATRSQYGQYLAEMAPYWREKMQSGFFETALMPGSLSLYGSDPTVHFELSNEVAAERLVRKYIVETHGKSETAWDWTVTGDNHFCDVLTGCFAVASWYRCYDNLSTIIDDVARTGVLRDLDQPPPEPIAPHVQHQDDLFDPLKNPALAAARPEPAYDRGCERELAEYERTHPSAQPPEAPEAPAAAALPPPRFRRIKPKFRKGKYKR